MDQHADGMPLRPKIVLIVALVAAILATSPAEALAVVLALTIAAGHGLAAAREET